jgi:hypothetical protein
MALEEKSSHHMSMDCEMVGVGPGGHSFVLHLHHQLEWLKTKQPFHLRVPFAKKISWAGHAHSTEMPTI